MIRKPKGEDGAILVLALIVVTTVSLVVGAVLTRGDGSLRATVALREVAGSAYASDAAAQVAINDLRTGYSVDPTKVTPVPPATTWAFNNTDDGSGCFGRTTDAAGNPTPVTTLPLSNFYPATGTQSTPTSALVECQPEKGTGAQGSPVIITKDNKPGNAILTLGTDPGEIGLYTKPLGSAGALRVHGGVISNSTITADNGGLESNVSILAHSGCTGTITAPTKDCGAAVAPDPGYAPETTVVPPYRTVPSTCPGKVVTFQPGYYDDATALTDLMANSSSCKNSTWWFTPGTYYFDFHNNSTDPLASAGVATKNSISADQWVVATGTLLAGTPTDSSGNVIAAPTSSPTVPGACQNPIDDASTVGVQFIFGGDSQLQFSGSANGEICGSYNTSRPPIGLYGLKSGIASPTTLSGANTLTASTASSSQFGAPTAPQVAQIGDGKTATWAKSGKSNETGTLTLKGFAPSTPIPAGSVLTGATVRVAHQEPTPATNPSGKPSATAAPTLTITPAGSSALPALALSGFTGSIQTDTIDLSKTSGWSALQTAVHANGFTGASMDYAVALTDPGTEIVDAVQLDLTYYIPQFRAEDATSIPSNCLLVGGGCAVLSSTTGYSGFFYVQGTTYTPISKIDLTLNNATEQVFRFGVVARSLALKETGSFAYKGPVFQIPDDSPGYGTNNSVVQLIVHLCPGLSTCTTSDPVALKLRVQLYDSTGTPNPPKRQVSILSWSEQR